MRAEAETTRNLVRYVPWSLVAPAVALVALAATSTSTPGNVVLFVVALLLAGAVLASVHHAEVVAHRVGEPFGSLILAVAVSRGISAMTTLIPASSVPSIATATVPLRTSCGPRGMVTRQ